MLIRYVFGHQLDLLRNGEVDFALTYLPFAVDELRGIEVVVLREEPRAVYLAADHPLAGRSSLSVDDIADETILDEPTVPGFSPTWVDFWTLRNERRGRGRSFRLPVSSYEDHAAAIAQGLAVAVAPASVIDYYRGRNMVAVPLADVAPARTALLSLQNSSGPELAAFIAAVRKVAPEGSGSPGDERTDSG